MTAAGHVQLRASRPRRAAMVAVALGVVAALVAAVALASRTTSASAASLAVHARASFGQSAARCTSTPLTVTPSATSGATTTAVSVTGLTSADLSACAGATLTLRVVDAGGNQLAYVTTTSLAAGVTLPVSFTTASAASALVDVGGFAVPTTWTAPPPPGPGSTCLVRDGSGAQAAGYSCTASVAAYTWQVQGGVTQYMEGQVSFVLFQGQQQTSTLPAGYRLEFTATFPSTNPYDPGAPAPDWSQASVARAWTDYTDPSKGKLLTLGCAAVANRTISGTTTLITNDHFSARFDFTQGPSQTCPQIG